LDDAAVNLLSLKDENRNAEKGYEWTTWALKEDFSRIIGSRKFIDSKGIIRYVGIGCVDVESMDVNSKRMRCAQDMALQMGRKNLALSLYSEMTAIESFSKVFSEIESENIYNVMRKDVFKGEVMRETSGFSFAPEVYATFAVHPITKRKMFVSVCGYEPWQLVQMGFGKRTLRDRDGVLSKQDDKIRKNNSECSRVKILNPSTGKFE
jgi:hypothetical protein